MADEIAKYFKPDFSDYFGNYSDYLYQEFYNHLKKGPWYSMYYNGTKYFFFTWDVKIFTLPEWKVALALSSLTYVGVVGTRKLFA